MQISDIVIAGATRTAVGAFNGAFANIPAHELGAAVIREAISRAKVEPGEVDEVILGQILTAGEGQNPARQAAIGAGLPKEATAFGINQLCGSGLRSVALGMQQIVTGDARIVVAGGQESMSMAPHCAHLRGGVKMGDFQMVDTMIKDGLWDAFNGYHMGNTAENVAREFQITRETQDTFALKSQHKAEAAQNADRFKDEIVPFTVKTRKGDVVVDKDEYPRAGATIEALQKLRPAFAKDGSVTAGNASGINDGAGAVVLTSERRAAAAGLTPLARIIGYAHAGVEPGLMGIGPVPAVRSLLARTGLTIEDFDLVESNEAFAAQALAVSRDLGFDPAKTNPDGGAIALGHPVGATGAILTVKAISHLNRTGGRRALITMCIGGGQGIALAIERI